MYAVCTIYSHSNSRSSQCSPYVQGWESSNGHTQPTKAPAKGSGTLSPETVHCLSWECGHQEPRPISWKLNFFKTVEPSTLALALLRVFVSVGRNALNSD